MEDTVEIVPDEDGKRLITHKEMMEHGVEAFKSMERYILEECRRHNMVVTAVDTDEGTLIRWSPTWVL